MPKAISSNVNFLEEQFNIAIKDALKESNNQEEIIDNFFKHITNHLGGLILYVPTSLYFSIRSRNKKILEEYDKGASVLQLARRYNMTTQWIYSILKKGKNK